MPRLELSLTSNRVLQKRMRVSSSRQSQLTESQSQKLREQFVQMMEIRLFEEKILREFPTGKLFGTTHTYIGQEANAVGILSAARRHDVVFSNHRAHGHFLAHGGDMKGLFAELMGKETGVCGGLGGSQHLQWNNFYSNGILGGTVPCATGIAMAEKIKKSGAISIVFMGDGTLGEGVVYESLNIASLWKLPMLYVVENNRYAQSTPIELNLAGSITARFEAFGIPAVELNTTDVGVVHESARRLIDDVRRLKEPRCLVIETYRFSPHSKGDDSRDPDEIAYHRQYDPLLMLDDVLSEEKRSELATAAEKKVLEAFRRAEDDPYRQVDSGVLIGLEREN